MQRGAEKTYNQTHHEKDLERNVRHLQVRKDNINVLGEMTNNILI